MYRWKVVGSLWRCSNVVCVSCESTDIPRTKCAIVMLRDYTTPRRTSLEIVPGTRGMRGERGRGLPKKGRKVPIIMTNQVKNNFLSQTF